MRREFDIGNLFSGKMTVSDVSIILGRKDIIITDENDYLLPTSDILKNISFLSQRISCMDNNWIDVVEVDAMLKNQNTITTENSKADKALDKFLSSFTINKTRSEVS